MDGNIRSLLENCHRDNKLKSLLQLYELLKRESSGNGPANVGTDLFVLCAEVACRVSSMFFRMILKNNVNMLIFLYICSAELTLNFYKPIIFMYDTNKCFN